MSGFHWGIKIEDDQYKKKKEEGGEEPVFVLLHFLVEDREMFFPFSQML